MAPALVKALAVPLLVASGLRDKRDSSKSDCYSPYDGKVLMKFTPPSKETRTLMENQIIAMECTDMSDGADVGAICDEKAAGVFKAVYTDAVEVLTGNAGAYFRQSSGLTQTYNSQASLSEGGLSADFYSNWRNYDARFDRMEAALANCGGAEFEALGSSYEGRSIQAVRFTGSGYTEGGPRVVVTFQLHAREWIAAMSGVYAVEQACQRFQEDPSWLEGMELVMVPVANPDGAIYSETTQRMWRKNTRVNSGTNCKGVDLNRNFGQDWNGTGSTSNNPCSDTFVGSGKFSEPEAEVLRDLIDEAPTSVHIDVHAYSSLIIAPWAYTVVPHPNRSTIDVVGYMMQSAIKAKHGKTYEYGGAEMLYPASGTYPDYTTSTGGFGFCYELRPQSAWGTGGFAPPTSEILPTAEECWEGILAAVTWSLDPSATLPPTPAPVNFKCNDGCDINDDYMNDGWCDCGECEDEDDNTCESCGGCPTYCGGYERCR